MKIGKLLDTIHQADPYELQKAQDKLSHLDPDHTEHIFEVDDKPYKVPFSTLRSYLSGAAVGASPEFEKEADVAKIEPIKPAKQVQKETLDAYNYAKAQDTEAPMEGYYWDDPNRGYEHMHPDAIKDQVLKRLKR